MSVVPHCLAAADTGWVVERYITNTLHYWYPGARGRGHRDDWSSDPAFVIRFAREEDATVVLLHACDGEGRVAQHQWVSSAQRTAVIP